jgi:hypothetical protein
MASLFLRRVAGFGLLGVALLAAVAGATEEAGSDVHAVSFMRAPELDEPQAAATPADDNFIYRLVHRLIPGPEPRQPPPADVAFPGPDTANFPDSPFTLPKGRSMIETIPCSYAFPGPGVGATWSWPFLMRTGLTDDLELRLYSQGPTVVGAADGEPGYDGFAPLVFDIKVHLWGERDWMFWPVVGVEAFLVSGIASRPFQIGTEPGLQLLVDHRLPGDIIVEWNVGYYGAGNPDLPDELSSPYVGASWAVQKQLREDFSVFYQGFYNTPNFPYFPSDLVSGFGAQWNATRRLALFGSYNWSLDGLGSPSGGYAGFAYAY